MKASAPRKAEQPQGSRPPGVPHQDHHLQQPHYNTVLHPPLEETGTPSTHTTPPRPHPSHTPPPSQGEDPHDCPAPHQTNHLTKVTPPKEPGDPKRWGEGWELEGGERSATRRFWRWWGCEGEACFPFGGGHLVVVRWLLSQRWCFPFRGGWSCMGAWCSKGFLWIPLVVPLRRGRWPLQGVFLRGILSCGGVLEVCVLVGKLAPLPTPTLPPEGAPSPNEDTRPTKGHQGIP